MLESFQKELYLLTLVIAGITAVLGFLVVHQFLRRKSSEKLSNTRVVIFSLLAFGYTCFALGELSWYVIFDIFKQLPSVSMPDLYWVAGSVSLLAGFMLYSFTLFKQRQELQKGLLIIFLEIVFFGVMLYYVLGANIIHENNAPGQIFLGYYYPLVSAFILLSSLSIYFLSRDQPFGSSWLYLLSANLAFFVGDLLYTYSAFRGYGLVGALSDIFYIAAYGLCSFFFLRVWQWNREIEKK